MRRRIISAIVGAGMAILMLTGATSSSCGGSGTAVQGPTHKVRLVTDKPPVWLGGTWVLKGHENGVPVWEWYPDA